MQKLLTTISKNDTFTVIPIPEGEIDTIPKLADSGFKVILKKVVPKSWTNKQVEANFKPHSLENRAIYFEVLRKVKRNNGKT